MASVPSIVRIYLFSAIFSYSFGLSYNVVGLYLEMLRAPINSVHQTTEKMLFLTKKPGKFGQKRTEHGTNTS